MGIEFICDACGKRERGWGNHLGDWFKPLKWYQRTVNGATQVACSRECIEKLGGIVAPF